jgi:membrane-associated phospholipid phosphatase
MTRLDRMPMSRPQCVTWAVVKIVVLALAATREAGAQFELRPKSAAFWTGAAVAIAGTSLLDEGIRSTTLAHQSGQLTTLADVGNALGTGRNIIIGLGLTYVVARVTHHRRTADEVLRVSAGYAVSNAIVGILKPVVGRHRPDSTNDAWRFQPFSSGGEWHSFPSSHAVHAFSIAAGAAIASKRSWVGALAYTGATVVAWSRVYDDQHWASDVTASAIIGVATAATTMKWLDRRFPPRRITPAPPR